MKDLLRTVGLFVIGSVLFGWAHDLVTAHVAVEYFTVHHPKLVESQSPLVMALLWGVVATWWVGAIGGAFVGIVNYVRRDPVPFAQLAKGLRRVLGGLWVSSMMVLVGILLFARTIPVTARRPSFDMDARLMAVAITHAYSYTAAAIAIVGFAVWVALTKRHLTQ